MSTDWMPAPDAEPESFDSTAELFGDATGMADLFAEASADTPDTATGADEAKAAEAEVAETPDAKAEAAPAAEAASDDATVPDTTETADDDQAASAEGDSPEPLAAEQANWGELWEARGRAKDILAAFTDGDPASLFAQLALASPVKAERAKAHILETGSLQHVAAQYGMEPDLVAARLKDQEPVAIPESLEAVLDAMPEAEADVVRRVLQQHAELAARATKAEETLQHREVEAQKQAQVQMEEGFRTDLLRMRQTNVLELAGANHPSGLLESIDNAAYANFLKNPEVEKAFDALEESIVERHSDDLQKIQSDKLNRLYRASILDELRIRGLKPVAPSKSKAAPPPVKEAAKPTPTVTTKTQAAPVKEPAKAAEAAAGAEKTRSGFVLPPVASVADILKELAGG